MKLKSPSGQQSINIGGVEYTADADGCVDIQEPRHIEVAIVNGFTMLNAIPITPTPVADVVNDHEDHA
ncbi:MAG: hypothetical protein JO253_08060 [Alphaproteobacteria bacterium]|nr:hypothetical protein [Alphaproteobacteria bacterium]